MIEPRMETLGETRLVGKMARMSVTKDATAQLWREFMPLRHRVVGVADASFWSVEVYPDLGFFTNFDPEREFEKWAAVPVSTFDSLAEGLETLLIPAGLYAVFKYRGKASDVQRMYGWIYGTWIPNSGYTLDPRPHFARMGADYKPDHPESEEELWIPVREEPRP